MRNLSLALLLVVASMFVALPVAIYAQANRDNALDVTCAIAGGASTQLLAARAGRYSFSINNTSGLDIRVAGAASGTATLTSANAFLIKAGQPYTDSAPGLYTGRLICQSTTAATATISVKETYR